LGIVALATAVAPSPAGVIGVGIAASAIWLFAAGEIAAAAIAGVAADSVQAQLGWPPSGSPRSSTRSEP
jgi:hypothetical protein